MVTQSAGEQAMSSVGDFRNLSVSCAKKNGFRNVQRERGQSADAKKNVIARPNAASKDTSSPVGGVLGREMRSIPGFLDRVPGLTVACSGVLLALAVGIAGKVAGRGIDVSFFYLLPVLLIAWKFAGRAPAVLMSLFCALLCFLTGVETGHAGHFAVPVWNGIVGLGVLLPAACSFSALKSVLQRERGLARIDYLTEVSNARNFYEQAEIEFARSERYKRPLSVVVVDIDNFKYVNDNFGHASGDQLLHSVAKTIQKTLRKTDTIARIGGDEFAILLPETESGAAIIAVNKVQDNLLRTMQKNEWPVTFSMGIITRMRTQCTLGNLMEMADSLMYEAKKNGKNMVLTGVC